MAAAAHDMGVLAQTPALIRKNLRYYPFCGAGWGQIRYPNSLNSESCPKISSFIGFNWRKPDRLKKQTRLPPGKPKPIFDTLIWDSSA